MKETIIILIGTILAVSSFVQLYLNFKTGQWNVLVTKQENSKLLEENEFLKAENRNSQRAIQRILKSKAHTATAIDNGQLFLLPSNWKELVAADAEKIKT